MVAGGSSGLGLHLATEAAARGATVTILGRDPAKLESAASQISSHSPVANATCTIRVDVLQLKENEEVQSWLRDNKIDFLINCIGRSDRGTLESIGVAEFETLFHSNPAVGQPIDRSRVRVVLVRVVCYELLRDRSLPS